MFVSSFRGYRLQNLTICLLHSLISGIWTTVFFLVYTKEMFDEVVHWYRPWAAQLPIISIGNVHLTDFRSSTTNESRQCIEAYFVHDAVDMLHHEWSRWTLELLVHHIATCFALLVGLLSGKFLLGDYWALLMEGNR